MAKLCSRAKRRDMGRSLPRDGVGNRSGIREPVETGRPENVTRIAALDLFSGCGGMTTGFQMAGLDRDCYVIAGAQTLRLVVRPGGFSDFSNIIRMIP